MARGSSSGFGSSGSTLQLGSGSIAGTFFEPARPTFVRVAKSLLLLTRVFLPDRLAGGSRATRRTKIRTYISFRTKPRSPTPFRAPELQSRRA